MALYKAQKTFAGKVTMARGEVKEVPEDVAKSLLKAGYIAALDGGKKAEAKAEAEEKTEAKPKKTRTKKEG